MVATGRQPNSEDLGLDDFGIECGRNGGIRVDTRMRTTRPGVYAAGDVTGEDQYVYMAAHGGKIAAHNALNGDAQRYTTASACPQWSSPIRQDMTVRELGELVFPYLTTVEGLKLAAQAFDKDVAKLSCCAG